MQLLKKNHNKSPHSNTVIDFSYFELEAAVRMTTWNGDFVNHSLSFTVIIIPISLGQQSKVQQNLKAWQVAMNQPSIVL